MSSRPFVIVTYEGAFAGKWLVVRTKDRRVIHEDASVVACSKWLEVWGPVLGYTTRGVPLADRFGRHPML